MTRSERIETATAFFVMLCIAGALWRPAWTGLDEAAFITLGVGIGLSYQWRTAADHERARRNVWLIPATAFAFAAQLVYFAESEARLRTGLLGAGLVAVAALLAWLRRGTR